MSFLCSKPSKALHFLWPIRGSWIRPHLSLMPSSLLTIVFPPPWPPSYSPNIPNKVLLRAFALDVLLAWNGFFHRYLYLFHRYLHLISSQYVLFIRKTLLNYPVYNSNSILPIQYFLTSAPYFPFLQSIYHPLNPLYLLFVFFPSPSYRNINSTSQGLNLFTATFFGPGAMLVP